MKIEIEIPKEFEEHFKQDKFKDSLERIMVDIWHLLENKNCLCAGNYEYETIEMLEKALENSKTAYNIDKIVEELEEAKHEKCLYDDDLENYQNGIDKAIEIVKQGSVSDYVCEWRIVDRPHNLPIYNTSCGKIRMQYTTGVDIYCNGCGKKIKVKQNDN